MAEREMSQVSQRDTPDKTEQIMVRLSPDLHARLKAYAVADERPVSQVVRRALEAYLAK